MNKRIGFQLFYAATVMMFALGMSFTAQAFPDTIRHGYTNCTTCHISPAGGGLLTPYGRSLSRELMSTWGYKNEEYPLHGAIAFNENSFETFTAGGDVRSLKRKVQSDAGTENENFLMQAQLRFGLLFEKVKFLVSVGKIENPRESEKVEWVSPEAYVVWTPKEEISIRAGRFEPIYGLRMPDHNLYIKSDIGFVPWNERDTVEFIWEGEKQFASVAGFQSTSDVMSGQQQTGYTASIYQLVGEKSRIGASAMNAEGQGLRSRSFSLHSTVSFTSRAYLMSELTRSWTLSNAKDLGFARFGFEAFKGFTPFLQGQMRLIRHDSGQDQSRGGGGIIWLPRPHFELMALYEEVNRPTETTKESMLLVHYYL